MNSSEKIKKVSFIITILIVIMGALAAWYTFSIISPSKQNLEQNKPSIEVNKDLYEQVTSPAKYGNDISTDEPGYGREDPFIPYK